jgi:DNA-binding LytR/AlgR family response regulator
VNALDYLMKPVTLERLQQTLERLNRHTEKEVLPAEQLLKEEDFLHLRGGGRQAFIPLGQLVAIESDGDYTRVHTAATGEFYIRRTMKEWLNMLPSELYQALDRKLIVGIAHVRELQSEDPTHGLLEMNGIDKVFPLGKTALRSARQMIKKLGY